jgi:hypothetical protein
VSGIFRTIDPPPPIHPASVSSPRAVRGWGVNISEDARHWIGLLHSYSMIPLRLVSSNQPVINLVPLWKNSLCLPSSGGSSQRCNTLEGFDIPLIQLLLSGVHVQIYKYMKIKFSPHPACNLIYSKISYYFGLQREQKVFGQPDCLKVEILCIFCRNLSAK